MRIPGMNLIAVSFLAGILVCQSASAAPPIVVPLEECEDHIGRWIEPDWSIIYSDGQDPNCAVTPILNVERWDSAPYTVNEGEYERASAADVVGNNCAPCCCGPSEGDGEHETWMHTGLTSGLSITRSYQFGFSTGFQHTVEVGAEVGFPVGAKMTAASSFGFSLTGSAGRSGDTEYSLDLQCGPDRVRPCWYVRYGFVFMIHKNFKAAVNHEYNVVTHFYSTDPGAAPCVHDGSRRVLEVISVSPTTLDTDRWQSAEAECRAISSRSCTDRDCGLIGPPPNALR